jgi:thiazolylpeptide-type bacteriocin precursor
MSTGTLDLSSFDLNVSDLGDFADLQVVSLGDAMAMPETGASSGISSCNSCSCCASTSCCSVNIKVAPVAE